ncbi:MAG: SOS response-associated peptidase [Planctomycetota bacterium]
MCGRFVMAIPASKLREMFKAENIPLLKARYNISPGQDAAVLFDDRTMGTATWGFARSAAMSGKQSALQFNSRVETFIKTLAGGSNATRHGQPCLVPASGFYEFTAATSGRLKQPWYFTLKDNEPMAMAGIVKRMTSDSATDVRFAFSILTTEANDCVRAYHQRMPVILPPDAYDRWLTHSFSAMKRNTPALDGISDLLKPFDSSRMSVRPVSNQVNNSRNDSPDLIEIIELKQPSPGLFD